MDKKINVDSQEKKSISAVNLKDKLKNGLLKQSEEETKLKNEVKTVSKTEETVLNEPSVISDPVIKRVINPPEELDIEELMKKYLPERDLKFARPLNLDETESNRDEKTDADIAHGIDGKEETVPADADEDKIENIIGQAGIVRTHQSAGESAYYADGKVSDEFVGDDNIYTEPGSDNTTGDISNSEYNEASVESEIRNIQSKRESVRHTKTKPDINHDTQKNIKKEQTAETEQQLLTYTHKPVQEEQLGQFIGQPETNELKRGGKRIEIEHRTENNKIRNEKADLPDTGLVPEKPLDENEIDDTDVKLMMAFGMDDELAQTVGFDKVNEVEEKLDRKSIDYKEAEGVKNKEKKVIEFNSVSQIKEIFRGYKLKYSGILIRLLASFVLLLIAFFYENIGLFGVSLPTPVNMAIYPVVNIMIGLQLLLIGGALIYKQLIDGIAALFTFKPIPESVTAVLMMISVLYQVAACFAGIGITLQMYNFPVLLCVLLTLVYEFLNLKREIFSFNIAASKRVKYAIVKMQGDEANLETEAFSQVLPESPQIFKINKTIFNDGFFERMRGNAKNKMLLSIIIPALVAAAFIFFAFGYIFTGKIYTSISLAYITLLISMPFSVFITYSYPFYKASKEAYGVDSAIIGESSLFEYSGANAISFEDREVFPSYGVKVKSVKVYGENRIDYIIYNAASLFLKTGGPLADVFDVATRDLGHSDNVEIIKVDSNGIEAIIEDAHIFIGKAAYIRNKGFYPKPEPDENENDAAGENCVMYMTLNNELAAKMYVQYVIDPDFEFVLKQLHKIGMCVGIKTFDPNIDDQMLSTKIKISKYPVKVLKCKSATDVTEVSERLNSGIISKNSAKTLLQTLSLCDKVINVTRNNIIIKIFSIVISLILLIVIFMLGKSTSVPSVYITLYQIFWMIPMIMITHICIGRL
jgi:hypothetical protein